MVRIAWWNMYQKSENLVQRLDQGRIFLRRPDGYSQPIAKPILVEPADIDASSLKFDMKIACCPSSGAPGRRREHEIRL